jgi:hypothetical protein
MRTSTEAERAENQAERGISDYASDFCFLVPFWTSMERWCVVNSIFSGRPFQIFNNFS